MSQTSPVSNVAVQPIGLLRARFDANCRALATRNPLLAARLVEMRPSSEYFIGVQNGQVVLVRRNATAAGVIPDPVPPAAARQVCSSIFRDGRCNEPVAVVGAGYGWLWNSLYTLPTPNDFRPPLYFLTGNVEELYAILHVHDWSTLLGDRRVHVFAGDDPVERFREALLANPRLALPRLSLDVDASLWRDGATYQRFVDTITRARIEQRERDQRQICATYAEMTTDILAEKVRSGAPLRVLGLASRRSTFLQYSMRDWLAGFRQLGHETKLLMEEDDSEVLDHGACVRTLAEFRPDVLLLLNHYRAEGAWLPREPIAVMWVQDDMPNVLSKKGATQQGERDFVVGYGRQECVHQFGYPATRFLSTRIGVNEERFSPEKLGASELRQYSCDVSYVSHASVTAEAHLETCLKEATGPDARRVLRETFDRLRAIYHAGGSVTELSFLRQHIDTAARDLKASLNDDDLSRLTQRVYQTINNAMFRHQSLEWLADAGVDLRLYGKGWENHPRLRRFARGAADNETQLRAIYQASRINLQIAPQGVVHQRLCDGLAAGGFFLLRYCGADVTGPIFEALWRWCREDGIEDDAELRRQATPEIRKQFDCLGWLVPDADAPMERAFIETLNRLATTEFSRFADGIWPSGTDAIAHVYRPLSEWCRANAPATDDQLRRLAPPNIRALLSQVGYFFEDERRPRDRYIVTFLRDHAEEAYDRFAASVWPAEYGRVSFRSREELLTRAEHHLAHEEERREIAQSMRRVVVEKFTYRAITQRLLGMIGRELANPAATVACAA